MLTQLLDFLGCSFHTSVASGKVDITFALVETEYLARGFIVEFVAGSLRRHIIQVERRTIYKIGVFGVPIFALIVMMIVV